MAKSEDEGPGKDNKYRHCFEVNTKGRGYLFCADTAEELESWVGTFKQIIFSDAADNLVSVEGFVVEGWSPQVCGGEGEGIVRLKCIDMPKLRTWEQLRSLGGGWGDEIGGETR